MDHGSYPVHCIVSSFASSELENESSIIKAPTRRTRWTAWARSPSEHPWSGDRFGILWHRRWWHLEEEIPYFYQPTSLHYDPVEEWHPGIMATRVWSAENNLQVNSMTKIILTKWRKEANIQFHCFILTSIIGGFFFMFFPSSIEYMVLENGRPETFPKSTRSNSLPVRKVRWPISILAQGWTASWCIESWWIYKMRGNLDELTSVPGCSPHDGIHSRKVPTSKAVERLFIIPRELAVPSGTTAMLGDFMLEEKGQWIDWVRNKLTYFNHVGQQKHPTKFVWESQFEVAMRGAALHRFQPSCQSEESLSPCSSLQRNSTPSSPKVFVDLHAGRFSPRNAHQSVEWMQLFRKTTENACKIC